MATLIKSAGSQENKLDTSYGIDDKEGELGDPKR